MDFVNREADLGELESLVAAPGAVLYRLAGRRRIGKTALLEQIIQRHDGIYLFTPEGDEVRILAELRRQAALESGEEVLPPEGWDGLFRFIERFEGRPVVFDEFQHVIEASATAVSLLQSAWDRRLQTGNHKVFLCGSSIGRMRRLTSGTRGPLFGRLTHDRRLGPFRFRDTALLYPRLPLADVLDRHAVFGGTPAYHAHAVAPTHGKEPTLEAAIRRTFLEATAPFREEPLQLLRFELKKPARYHAILAAIGNGHGTTTEIAQQLGLKATDLTRYIEYLRDELGLIAAQSRLPRQKRKTRYEFTDPFFKFYYTFVSPQMALLERGQADRAWQRIEAGLPTHRGRIAEALLGELFDQWNGTRVQGVQIAFDDRGRWWGPRRGNRTQIEEVDLVATGADRIYIGEVKWRQAPVDAGIWDRLSEKIRLIEPPRDRVLHPVLVSRAGFTPGCRRAAPEGAILLDGTTFLEALCALRGSGPATAP